MNQTGMRKNKNIPAIIMLLAGAIAVICSIVNQFTFLNTLKVTLVVLLIFYIVGLLAGKFIIKINEKAMEEYINSQKEEEALEEDSVTQEFDSEENLSEQLTATKDEVEALQKDSFKTEKNTSTKTAEKRKK